jgi:hypothetical protein
MTVARDDAVDRKHGDRSAWLFDQRQAGLGRADFRNGSRNCG